MTNRIIIIPSGRPVSVRAYVAAWKMLRQDEKAGIDCDVKDWGQFPCRGSAVLRDMRRGLVDRINQHEPSRPGRMANDPDLANCVRRLAEKANSPRMALHRGEWRHIPERWRRRIREDRWFVD